jgi:hypothetical protein
VAFDAKLYHQQWVKDNPERVKAHNKTRWAKSETQEWYKDYSQQDTRKVARRSTRYKNRYGITLEDYDEMYKSQKGLCAICGNPPKMGQRLYVDHNHETKKVRALLCQACNSGLGNFKEQITLLSNAIAYIEHFKEDE